jgi:glycosyltransferase involved in cell wall biosynthesis
MMNASIIVPVYNTEKYLRRCLDSILGQTFSDFECILVNDSSQDSSPLICDEYVRRDKRVRVIHNAKNQGSSIARRTGLEAVIGDYIESVYKVKKEAQTGKNDFWQYIAKEIEI